jgi:small-conductance mechanosensitive channel
VLGSLTPLGSEIMPSWKAVVDFLGSQDHWGNSLLRWFIVVVAALAAFVALRLARRLLVRHAGRLAETRAGDWFRGVECVAQQTRTWFLLILAVFGGAWFLFLSTAKELKTAMIAATIAVLVQGALWADALLLFAIARYAERNKDVDAASVATLSALGFFGRLAVWTAAVLLAVANMGVDVTAMVAGLGIGGVAVALAAQSILGDLFASASIVLDKPFVLGDFIVVGDEMGSVEHIGLKTTRLRSLTGEQLVFSNTDLLKSRIHNYRRMAERRVAFSVGLDYGTPYDKVAAVPAMLRQTVEAQKPVRFDRAHFAKYGDSALIFEVVYYVLSADYNVHMDVQQAINLDILRRFAAEKIEFASPARTASLRQSSQAGK